MPSVSVVISDLLRETVASADVDSLCEEFKWWKSDASLEYESPFFGKDSASISPTINGIKYSLRHVHLAPLNNAEELKKWAKKFKVRGRKQSDRVLFYVQEAERFYLVAVVDDPGAHELMRMADPQSRGFMLNVVKEAERMLAAAPV